MSERFITSELNAREESVDQGLRPQSFAEFPGQQAVKDRLASQSPAPTSPSGSPPANSR